MESLRLIEICNNRIMIDGWKSQRMRILSPYAELHKELKKKNTLLSIVNFDTILQNRLIITSIKYKTLLI